MHYLRQFIDVLLYPLRALLTSPSGIASGARKLASISLPARISIIFFVFLVLAAIASYLAFLDSPWRGTDWQDYIWLLPVLVIVIPIVLYYVLRLWMEGEVSRFPDIDYAWNAGIAEMRNNGLDIQYTPLFLVLGSPGDAVEKSLFGAAQLPLRIREVPTGAAALHWFAEPDGVYLVCSQVGSLSKLAEVAKRASEDQKAKGGATMPGAARRPAADPRGTMMQDPEASSTAPDAAPPEGDERHGNVKQSVMVSQIFPSAPGPRPTSDIRGTVSIARDDEAVVASHEPRPVAVSQNDQREQELRLEYLCRLIVKAREPLAPINGAMTLLPYGSVQRGGREGTELQRVVKRDLNTIVRTLQVRCPVVSLVIGMEEESGFRELVRRLGREPAMAQRFGKGFSVGNPPIPEQLEALATHACGLFEAKVYELFRAKGSFAKPGNRKLYALLCKIRRTVRLPLTNVLVNGYGHDPDVSGEADADPLFYSGCYFAATGESDDRQAFVKAVFEKLPAEQEELEWTEDALADEERYHRWSQTAVLINALLLVGPILMFVVYYFFTSR